MKLTTHVLDTARGVPAAEIPITLYAIVGDERRLVANAETDADGRTAVPLAADIEPGTYEVVFNVAAYFQRLETSSFYDAIAVRIRLIAGQESYHVPLLLAPWSYATYRGS